MGNELRASGHMENTEISKLELIARRFSSHGVSRIKHGEEYPLNAAGLRIGML
jgi:hypothetical protein